MLLLGMFKNKRFAFFSPLLLQEEDESKMHDTELDVDAFTCEAVHDGSFDSVQQSTEKLVLNVIKL